MHGIVVKMDGSGSQFPWILTLLAILLTTSVLRSLRNLRQLPKSLRWADQRDESFSKIRACVRQPFAGLRTLGSGYAKVCEQSPASLFA